MPGTYSKDERQKLAFVVTPDHLRDFVSIISSNIESESSLFGAPLDYSVTFPAGGSFRTDSLDEVLALANSGTKEIQEIRISTAFDVKPRIELEFSNSSRINNVLLRVTGTDKQVFFVADKLTEAIQRTRVWYTKIAHADVPMLFLSMLIILCAIGGLVTGVLYATGSVPNEPVMARDSATGTALGYVLAAVVFISAVAASRLKNRLFPAGIFLINDGIHRYERLHFWRRTVLFLGVLLPFGMQVATMLIFP